jgi:hypothetical protein
VATDKVSIVRSATSPPPCATVDREHKPEQWRGREVDQQGEGRFHPLAFALDQARDAQTVTASVNMVETTRVTAKAAPYSRSR